jgi:glucokinase
VSAREWLGLDVGGTKLEAVRVDDDLRVLQRARAATGRDAGPAAVLDRAAALLGSVRGDGRAAGAGVGFAGLVDAARGVVRSSIMLPGWSEVPLAGRLAAALDLPACADNDANAAGLCELLAHGARPGLNMVVLTVGTGIGAALILDGRLYRGTHGLAGELGNTTLDWQGVECWCGNRGCANMLASGSALARLAAEQGVGDGSPAAAETVVALARAGDARAAAVLEQVARALGALVANAINAFDPERVALAGGLAGLDDGFLAAVRAEARRRAFAEAAAHVAIERAVHGAGAGALGAAALARERFGERR